MSNATCPVCYNCQTTPCSTFGTCSSSKCICPVGFGTEDCSKPLCGSLTQFAQNRPVSNLVDPCACIKDWQGPNCHVCQSNDVCVSTAIGTTLTCNKSPVAFDKSHHASCKVEDPLLKAAFGSGGQVSVKRDTKENTMFATVWLGPVPQFSCQGTDCKQTGFDKNLTTSNYQCNSISCQCQPGTKMCGGALIDITSTINQASGSVQVNCNNATCHLELDFIKILFPKGITLSECNYGECVVPLLIPVSAEEVKGIDVIGVTALSIAGFLILAGILLLLLGIFDRNKKRKLPVPANAVGMEMVFDNVSYDLKKRNILSQVCGGVQAGQLLAIMGPSGSGKTTFLDIIAKKRKTGTISGRVLINGEEIHDTEIFKKLTGYVDQEDIHIPVLTVQETLEFSASVRLPESVSATEKSARVQTVLKQLGLSHIAQSRVGDALRRGISGGEKKRLSIAVELVTNPPIIFIDEPTSGLDSFNALQVIQTLSSLARDFQKTVVFTVHQPNSAIYSLFDNVLLLSRGKSVYFGPAKDAEVYWNTHGHPCPTSYHIADHLLDVASSTPAVQPVVVEVDGLRFRGKKDDGITNYIEPFIVRSGDLGNSTSSFVDPFHSLQGASRLTQLQQVLGRELKVFFRAPTLFISHLSLSIVLGVFIGMLYYHVDNTLAGLQNRLGSIFFMQALLAFGGLSAISSLSVDRVLFIRERASGFYTPEVYFLQKVLFDLIPLRLIPALILVSISYFLIGFTNTSAAFLKFLVIMVVFSMNAGLHGLAIASLIPETSTSTLTAVMSILFQMLFSGILVNQVNIPIGLRWIQYISFFKYAYEGCIASEAGGLSVVTTIAGVDVNIPASVVLKSFGLDANAYYFDMAVTFAVWGGLMLVIWGVMRARLTERR